MTDQTQYIGEDGEWFLGNDDRFDLEELKNFICEKGLQFKAVRLSVVCFVLDVFSICVAVLCRLKNASRFATILGSCK